MSTNRRETFDTTDNERLEAALRYSKRVWAIFLLHFPDPEQIRGRWSGLPEANIGLVSGARSRLFVLDVDGPADRKDARLPAHEPKTHQ